MKTKALIAFLLISASGANANSEIENLRIQAALGVVTALALDTVDAPVNQLAYVKLMALYIIDNQGAFIFKADETISRQPVTRQIGYQAGQLIAFCTTETSVPFDSLLIEGVSVEEVQALCL